MPITMQCGGKPKNSPTLTANIIVKLWFKTFNTKKLPHFQTALDVSFLMEYPVLVILLKNIEENAFLFVENFYFIFQFSPYFDSQ